MQSTTVNYQDLTLPRDARPGKGLRVLALLTIAGLSLVTIRVFLTENWWYFIMLTWNLFLAWFPLGVVLILRDLRAKGNTVTWFRSRWLMIGALML